MIGPTCPRCERLAPFRKTQLSLGSPFSCAGCDSTLVISRSNALWFGWGLTFVFLIGLGRFPPEWGGDIGLFAAIVIVGLPVTWALTKVRLAES